MLKTKDTWNALMRRIALKSAPSLCLLVGVATGLLGCTGVAPTRPTGVDVLKRIPGVGFDEAYASRVMLDHRKRGGVRHFGSSPNRSQTGNGEA